MNCKKASFQIQVCFIQMFRSDIQNSTTVLSLAILDNTDNISLVRGDVFANEAHINSAIRRIDENKAYINSNENAISQNHDSIAQNQNAIAENQNAISGLETSVGKFLIRGAQCGYRYKWTSSSSTITYESLLLDTGRGSLDLSSGEWKAEEKGIYQVTWSLYNELNDGEQKEIHLFKNGELVSESMHRSFNNPSNGSIRDQGGRSLLLEMDVGDRLYLGTHSSYFTGEAFSITFCVNILSID